jgi:hypothetical protein
MYYFHEQLVRDHIRELHEEAEAARQVRQARRAAGPSRAGRILRRIGHVTRRPAPALGSPVRTLDPTTTT